MQLHPNWRAIARHSSSFWLALGLGLGEAVQAGMDLYFDGRLGAAAATSVVSFGISAARVIRQEALSGADT